MNKVMAGRVSLISLIVLSGWLGFSCLNYSTYAQVINQKTPSIDTMLPALFEYNLLASKHEVASTEMELQAQELARVLEFMVWPAERIKLLVQLTQLTKQQINQQPTRIKYWQRLLKAQYELTPGAASLTPILEKVYKLGGWNNNWMINLSRYCVPFFFKNEAEVPGVCNQIISHLPQQDQTRALARRIGISEEDLDFVLSPHQSK